MHIILSDYKEKNMIMGMLRGIQKTIQEGIGQEGINEL